ncbi:MAG: hypothetical protein ACK41W_11330 [Cyanobacteriota bacterium]
MTTNDIHITVAVLEERLGGIEKHLARQTEALEKLADNAVQIALIQRETKHLKEAVEAIHARLETHLTSHRQTTMGIMFEVLKVTLAIMGGALMAKYGLK